MQVEDEVKSKDASEKKEDPEQQNEAVNDVPVQNEDLINRDSLLENNQQENQDKVPNLIEEQKNDNQLIVP